MTNQEVILKWLPKAVTTMMFAQYQGNEITIETSDAFGLCSGRIYPNNKIIGAEDYFEHTEDPRILSLVRKYGLRANTWKEVVYEMIQSHNIMLAFSKRHIIVRLYLGDLTVEKTFGGRHQIQPDELDKLLTETFA